MCVMHKKMYIPRVKAGNESSRILKGAGVSYKSYVKEIVKPIPDMQTLLNADTLLLGCFYR